MQHHIDITPIRHRARYARCDLEDALRADEEAVIIIIPDLHGELPAAERAHARPGRVGGELVRPTGRDGQGLEGDGGGELDGLVGGEVGGGEC